VALWECKSDMEGILTDRERKGSGLVASRPDPFLSLFSLF